MSYSNLPAYFLLFSVWNGLQCLSWDDTVEWAGLLNLHTVPVLYRGIWDEQIIKDLKVDTATQEGYVVRIVESFKMRDFPKVVGKWVRPNHVTTNTHWKHQTVVPNGLEHK